MKSSPKELEKILKALGNRRRLMIVKYLQKTHGATVGSITDEIRASFKATSKHLAVLFAADVVEREQMGLTVMYRLTEPIHAVVKTSLESM